MERGSRMNVLIVTKDDERAAGLTDSLSKAGHEVERAPSPAEGLAKVKEAVPGCVVLESDENGAELKSFRSSLESRVSDRSVPVLPLRSGDDPQSIVRGIAEILEAEEAGSQEVAATSGPVKDAVLIIDDREVHRRRIASQLAGEGWRVLEAEDGRKGALMIIDDRIDCLLVNSVLGGKTSHGIVRSAVQIRKVHPHPFSILVATDADDAAQIDQILESGADDVIVRRAGPAGMLRRLRTALILRGLLRENRRLKERLAAKDSSRTA